METVFTPTQAQTFSPVITSKKINEQYLQPDVNSTLRFEHLGLVDGLSQSVIHAILQDHLGFLWIGTEDGLNRYDGYNFNVYRPDPENPDSINDRWITYLYEDSRGHLWIGTRNGGLNHYDPTNGIFSHFMHDPLDGNGLTGNRVNVILEDNQGNLWIGTDAGLNRMDLDTGEIKYFSNPSRVSSGTPRDYVTALYEDSSGILWVGTQDGGLNKFDTTIFTYHAYNSFCYLDFQEYCVENTINRAGGVAEIVQECRLEEDHYCVRIHAITEDQNGNLLIGTSNGLSHLNIEDESITRYEPFEQFTSLTDNSVLSLYKDRAGVLWVGTNDGLIRFNEKNQEFLHYKSVDGDSTSLSNNTITTIFEDTGGILWIGTAGGGLNKYNRGQHKFTYYYHEPNNINSLSSNFISSIHSDSLGRIWIGTSGSGLNQFIPSLNLFLRYQHDGQDSSSLLSNVVTSIYIDRGETLWVGSDLGLSRLNRGDSEFTHYRYSRKFPDGLAGAPVHTIYEDRARTLWIGTAGGLDILDPNTGIFTHFRVDEELQDNLGNNAISAILEDSYGELWIGTLDNGLTRINPNRNNFTSYQYNPNNLLGLAHNSITAIYEDSKKQLWIATAGGGLNLYDREADRFIQYAEKNGLPNNVIYGIVEDDGGSLWLSTNFGLSRFNPETEIFRNYSTSDGLQSNRFNMGAYAKGRDGDLYFGGVNGLNVFTPSKIKDSEYAPPIVLTGFSQGEQSLSNKPHGELIQEITLTWPQNDFSFEFAALSYAQPDRNQYAYKLENFDEDWNHIGNNREGRYTNLPGGTYTLHIKGSNGDGVWNENGQSIQITIVPPFWQTWAFRILAALGVIGLGIMYYRTRVRSIEAQNLQLEHLVDERTKALQKRTEEMEALYSGDEKIIRAMTLDQVFQAVVEVAVNMLHADRSVVFVWDESQTQVVPRVSHGFKPESLKVLHFEKGEGMVGKVLETGDPLLAPEVDLEAFRPDVRAAIVAEGIHSLIHLPIKVNEQIIGVFNVGFTRPGAITGDTARLFAALVQRAALSVENMELFEQTKELAVVEERNRVARDLHDSAKQKAFAALAQLGAVNGILKKDPENAWSHLSEAENLVYEVIQELTFLIQEMYPMALKEKGLATTLREYIFEWENRNGIMIDLVIKNARRMDLEMEQAVYRMIQEALANVARHSQSDKVDVSLIYNADAVAVTVEDNGIGFSEKQKSNGMGLRIIEERAESIGGHACIESEQGIGTKVIITAPLNGHS